VVHGIKGSSRGIFAEKIGDIAEALENAASAGDYGYIEKDTATLVKAIRFLISDITKMLKEFDEDNLKATKDKPDIETLERLCRACVNYDMNSVDDALDELETFDYENDGDLVVWLRENVEQMNFEEIIEKLSVKTDSR